MRLLLKQRMFSWFDSYDIYDEKGYTVFTVRGQLSWGHCFKIFDASGNERGMVRQKIFTFLPKFEIFVGNNYVGRISRKISFFRPQYSVDFNGWDVEGNFFEWDYDITDSYGKIVARISKHLNWTDTYEINVGETANAIPALMVVLAIDAEKCSRNGGNDRIGFDLFR